MYNRKDVKVDITYGERIELGALLATQNEEDYYYLSNAFKILYKRNMSGIKEYKMFAEDFQSNVIDGIVYWMELEREYLSSEATSDEIAAGANEMKTAKMGTIYKLARDYGQDPDTILEWKYTKVFGILWNDAELARYEKRLNEIHNNKR